MKNQTHLGVSELGFRYGGQTILADCTASFPRGKITALLGPNGAGKSTLLKLAAGLLPLQTGHLTGAGQDRLAHSRLCAWMPAVTQVAFNFSVFDIVRMGLYPWHLGSPSKSDDQAAMSALTEVCAAELADRQVWKLSSGERQRVMLARALVGPVDYLLLDEPLTNLDLQTSFVVLDILRKRAEQGVGIVISMHDLALAAQLTDQFVCLHRGRMVGSGSLHLALSQGLAERVFGVKAELVSDRWNLSKLTTEIPGNLAKP